MPPADSNHQSFPTVNAPAGGYGRRSTVDGGVPDLFQSCTRHKLDDLPVFLLSFQAYSCHLIAMIKPSPVHFIEPIFGGQTTVLSHHVNEVFHWKASDYSPTSP